MRSKDGFILAHVAVFSMVCAVVIGGMLTWLLHAQGAAESLNRSRQFRDETSRVTVAATAIVRQNLAENNPDIFAGLTVARLNSFVSADPRFPDKTPGAALTPGMRVTSLTAAPSPVFFDPGYGFAQGTGYGTLNNLRQYVHEVQIPVVLSWRKNPNEIASSLPAKEAAIKIRVREIPLTEFSLTAIEKLSVDSGLTFAGTSLTLGETVRNDATFALRVSPFDVSPSVIGMNEYLWRAPGMAASLMSAFGTMIDPQGTVSENRKSIHRGTEISFDGHTLSSNGLIPSGIDVRVVEGSKRVVIDLGAVPQTNSLIDSRLPGAPGNQISAYQVTCTNALARDRGVVIVGTANPRICDYVTTNGALLFSGSHSGGPIFAASSFGGARFLNSGDASWNLYLALLCPAPLVSGSSDRATFPSSRPITISSKTYSLSQLENAYDTIGFNVSWSGSALLLQFGEATGAVVLSSGATDITPNLRVSRGQTFTYPTIPHSAGYNFVYSRTQGAFRIVAGFTSYLTLPADRPRIETSIIRWPGQNPAVISVQTSAAGATLGAGTGTVTIRGLLCSGTVTRFGDGYFQVSPSSQGDILERVVPRILVVE